MEIYLYFIDIYFRSYLNHMFYLIWEKT